MQPIYHSIYGKGNIISQRGGGFEYLVDFETGIRRWIRFDEMTDQSSIKKEKIEIKSTLPLSLAQFDARQTIESLRMGVVPYQAIEHITVGRSKEIQQTKKWLEKKKSGPLFLRGEYGSGKSHFLEYSRLSALNNGWAISFVEVGLEENPFFKPHLIYREIIKNFRANINGRELNFRSFMKEAFEKEPIERMESHLFFGKMKELLAIEEDEEKVWEWIEGDYDWFRPKLYRVGTASNLYCYLLNGISRIVEEMMNLKGFLLLFDEAEFMNESDYSYQLSKGKTFFKALTYLSNNKMFLINESISHLKFGRQSGLQYCGFPRNNPIRYAWELPSNLKIIFAMTPIEGYPGVSVELEPLTNKDLKVLLQNIFHYYKIAYNQNLDDLDQSLIYRKLPKEKTRKFIKQVIEILDILRFNPTKKVHDLI